MAAQHGAERLEAALLAERRVQGDLDARVAAGGLGADERAAYEAQLERLRALVERLRRESAGAPTAYRPSDGGPAPALTPHERTAVLDQKLDAAIGAFDEMLLREQRALEQRARTASGGGASAAAGAAGAAGEVGTFTGGASPGGRWTDPARDVAAAEPSAPEQPTRAGGEGGAGGATGRGERKPGTYVAATRADGGDDDVVARQLREAAERETDPELRERLWEEYHRYKEGRR
jgi:hypothetical protein